MSDSAAVLFALSMVVWVADVRFAPKPTAAPTVACESGPNAAPPADVDAEVVICAGRSK